MKARSDVELLIEYLRPANAVGKGPGRGLEVVEEEAARVLAELARDPAAGGVDRGEDVPQLVGERGLGDRALADAEDLDRPLQRGALVLVQRADHVVRGRQVLVAVEAAARERDQVRRVQLRVLAVDGDEELDHLVGREAVENDRRHLEVPQAVLFGQLVEGQEPVLSVQGPEDARLLGELEGAGVGAAAGGANSRRFSDTSRTLPGIAGRVPESAHWR